MCFVCRCCCWRLVLLCLFFYRCLCVSVCRTVSSTHLVVSWISIIRLDLLSNHSHGQNWPETVHLHHTKWHIAVVFRFFLCNYLSCRITEEHFLYCFWRCDCDVIELNLFFLTRCLSFSQSIPISHSPSGRWDKCRRSPWPVKRGREPRKMREGRGCRRSLASLLLSDGQNGEIQKPGGHWRGWRTKRGQLLHSVVSFHHSFLCLVTHLLPGCMCVFF